MDLELTAAEQRFRAEVRAFVEANLPPAVRDKVLRGRRLDRDDFLTWHRILYRRGWSAPNWPREHGGPGWNAVEQYIFDEECALAGAPLLMPFGIRMVAPVLMEFGSPAQQERFLPAIRSGEHWWCQGYSEPGAGSDLASLVTRAERRGDHYVVNGQKTWTTLAQFADWIFCLVRTARDGRPQAGISFLLIDMRSNGVEVRPIVTLDGEVEVNEVWFSDVEVPVDNRVGEENRGWTYAKYLLGHERTANAGVGTCKLWLAQLKQLAATVDDRRLRDKVSQLEIELMAFEITNLRVIAMEVARRAPGPEASILKVQGTELQQALTEVTMEALGPRATRFADADPPAMARYLNYRKASIYAGSNEIQRNIIAKLMLGL